MLCSNQVPNKEPSMEGENKQRRVPVLWLYILMLCDVSSSGIILCFRLHTDHQIPIHTAQKVYRVPGQDKLMSVSSTQILFETMTKSNEPFDHDRKSTAIYISLMIECIELPRVVLLFILWVKDMYLQRHLWWAPWVCIIECMICWREPYWRQPFEIWSSLPFHCLFWMWIFWELFKDESLIKKKPGNA